ncbi:MAG TPA: glycoside-pentoside-hexuronide (GPH):cation symporter [Candidatus Blautia pullicola]|jgi:GPH family glycoside/pentoside/hexuronide:cation symporter|uniref:Glycoside-pentoside-hexuronide (GPH):cation symporter n=1 Tax=Candidatus Blautia pullicola TaxID=2838498 RepID=A0A9D2JRN4_9FIRM|nr:glycoside-pentoside-hexuronide (GPH):cation symporter [Candidatus Blautia pullicola]
MKEMKSKIRPFGMRDKIGYAFGDIANDMTFILSSSFLLKFYTDVMGVPAYIVGIMMMAARFVDAFTDIFMGRVVDTAKVGKNGKFRPWILRAAGPVAVMSFLMYASWFRDMGLTFKVIWMFATYLLWGSVFYTMVNVPYGSMASGLTNVPKERTQLSTYRTVGATVASMVIGIVIPMFAYYTDKDGNRVLNGGIFSVIAFICSALAIGCYLVCYFNCTERVKINPQPKTAGKRNNFFVNIVTNKALLTLILANICLLLSQLTMSQMANYVYPNYYGNTEIQALSTTLCSLVTFAIAPFSTPLASRFGKKEVGSVSCAVAALSWVVCLIVHPETAWGYMIFTIVAYTGMGAFNMLCWAFIVDVIDYSEVKNHVREDGTTYSCYSFARKISQAASSGLSGALLSIAGYSTATAFEPEVTSKIFTISCVVPAAGFLLVAVIMGVLYPLKKTLVEENCAILEKRREENK